MSQPGREPLLDPAFLRRLQSLSLASSRVQASRLVGRRRSPATGSSLEFADYRTYTPGDDYRHIDWNAFARLERLFLRLYRAEQGLAVALVLDTSGSMAWGQPSKARLATRLAAAISFIALRGDDSVDLVACRGGEVADIRPRLSGQAAIWSAWRFLERLSFQGATDLERSLVAYARQLRRPGLAVVVSDLFSPSGYQQGISALLAARQDVVLVQTLAPDELAPPADLEGEWRLVDSEALEVVVDVPITPTAIRAYRRILAAYTQEIAEFCRRRGVTCLQLRSDVRIEDVLLRTFRQAGVLV